jgi:hypothetical protein
MEKTVARRNLKGAFALPETMIFLALSAFVVTRSNQKIKQQRMDAGN